MYPPKIGPQPPWNHDANDLAAIFEALFNEYFSIASTLKVDFPYIDYIFRMLFCSIYRPLSLLAHALIGLTQEKVLTIA